MTDSQFVIALDQGTSSSRSVLYGLSGKEIAVSRRSLAVQFPQEGWVEQDPMELWTSIEETLKEVAFGIAARQIVAIGLTNQRETIIGWDRESGKPIGPAIVWQCRRSSEICSGLKEKAEWLKEKTGLVPDPYFSASKIQWMLENIPGLRERVQRGEVVFGTVDAWILYKLSMGKIFATDPSNASRTMLFNLHTGDWDPELLDLFGLQRKSLPIIRPSNHPFLTVPIKGCDIPVTAVLGDQQASLYGHSGDTLGAAKCTFGTGAFFLVNTGSQPIASSNGLLATIALGAPHCTYALEGSIFVAGALIQWLRDKLGIIQTAEECEVVAGSVGDSGDLILVPSFVGLGAPHWDSSARGAIFGLTRDTTKGHIVRAALEGIAHQVADLFECPELSSVHEISIDGGMSANKLFCQILADLTGRSVRVAPYQEMTAFGVAKLALKYFGLEEGFRSSQSNEDVLWYQPCRDLRDVADVRRRWKGAVERVKDQ